MSKSGSTSQSIAAIANLGSINFVIIRERTSADKSATIMRSTASCQPRSSVTMRVEIPAAEPAAINVNTGAHAAPLLRAMAAIGTRQPVVAGRNTPKKLEARTARDGVL
ncbi:MAG: hypothetical protein A2074_01505 [Candidatus Aquicultor primus]|uniref:Uncharacterized protein n=1 Tax=Candidatus Aquicultor primus TaxID=1797195 RepID=A0A1F2UP18_9ACTN|nr:MAG: hypothetical protein A2074_01505 [Candidatus Aquicultor primus]